MPLGANDAEETDAGASGHFAFRQRSVRFSVPSRPTAATSFEFRFSTFGGRHSAAAIQSDSEHGQLQADALVAISAEYAAHLFLCVLAGRVSAAHGAGRAAVHREIEFRGQSVYAGRRRGRAQIR